MPLCINDLRREVLTFYHWIVMEMKLNSALLVLLPLLFITYGTAYITPPASADGVVKPIDIGLYWDQEWIHPVSSINFGTVGRGESKSVEFWLKNLGTEKGRISWDSANFNPSSGWITATWEHKVGKFTYIANWHEKIKTGDSWEIRYTLHVAQDAQVGMYSGDLTVCLVVPHKISCRTTAFILTVRE